MHELLVFFIWTLADLFVETKTKHRARSGIAYNRGSDNAKRRKIITCRTKQQLKLLLFNSVHSFEFRCSRWARKAGVGDKRTATTCLSLSPPLPSVRSDALVQSGKAEFTQCNSYVSSIYGGSQCALLAVDSIKKRPPIENNENRRKSNIKIDEKCGSSGAFFGTSN